MALVNFLFPFALYCLCVDGTPDQAGYGLPGAAHVHANDIIRLKSINFAVVIQCAFSECDLLPLPPPPSNSSYSFPQLHNCELVLG